VAATNQKLVRGTWLASSCPAGSSSGQIRSTTQGRMPLGKPFTPTRKQDVHCRCRRPLLSSPPPAIVHRRRRRGQRREKHCRRRPAVACRRRYRCYRLRRAAALFSRRRRLATASPPPPHRHLAAAAACRCRRLPPPPSPPSPPPSQLGRARIWRAGRGPVADTRTARLPLRTSSGATRT